MVSPQIGEQSRFCLRQLPGVHGSCCQEQFFFCKDDLLLPVPPPGQVQHAGTLGKAACQDLCRLLGPVCGTEIRHSQRAVFLQQVRTAFFRSFYGFFSPPCLHFPVSPGKEHLGNLFSMPDFRSGIMRVFQQVVLHGFKLGRLLIAQHAGNKAGNGIDHDTGSQLPSGQHIVADGYIVCHHFLQHPLVNAFVMPAEKDQLFFQRQFLHHGLMKYLSLGREINASGTFSLFGCPGIFPHRLIGTPHRLRLHHHARAASVRVIIHPHVLIVCKIPDIYRMQRNFSAFYCPSRDAGIDGILDHLRKQG